MQSRTKAMSKASWLQDIEKRFPWSFFGVLLALVFGAYAVATTIVEKRPEVEYQLLNAANVLDLHKPLQDLKIFFMGEDIQQAAKNLRVYTIRVANVGRINILESFFDSQQQWGIRFSGADIVQTPRIVDSNSDYLKEHICPVARTNSVVAFNKLILESGKYFTVETLVLHDKDSPPELSVLGKIAGIDDPRISPPPRKEISFFGKVFYGNWLVQLVRAVLYFVGTILFIAALIALSEAIGGIKKRRVRKHIKKRLAPFLDGLDEESSELASRLAVETDCKLERLHELLKEVTDEERLEKNIATAKEFFELREARGPDDPRMHVMYPMPFPIGFLTKTGDGKVIIDESAVATLKALIQFLESERDRNRIG